MVFLNHKRIVTDSIQASPRTKKFLVFSFFGQRRWYLLVKVIKKVNNNVAIALNDKDQEVFIVGKGVGFKTVPYELEDDSEVIDKVFVAIQDHSYYKMFDQIPSEIILMTQKIIDHAEKKLGVELQPRLLLTLSDHIHYTIERYNENLEIKSLINFEVRHIYPKEYAVANDSVDYINQTLSISLAASEAAFIAMHYVNAQMSTGEVPRVSLFDILSDITSLVKYLFKIDIEEDQLNYERFVTHIRLLVERQLASVESVVENKPLYLIARKQYPQEADCVDRIAELLRANYNLKSSTDEKLYLLLHIRRLTQRTSY